MQADAHNLASDAALRIYAKVLDAVRADRLVGEAMQRVGDQLFVQGERYDLSRYRRLLVCGAGKASPAMASAVASVLGRVDGGLVVGKEPSEAKAYEIRVGSHPVPDRSSLEAGEAMLRLAAEASADDLVVFVLSGGASSLMEAPIDGVDLDDLRQANDFLLGSGQPIELVNAVRSRLSRIKAGGLAKAFAPAEVIVLVLSDVVGNRLDSVGSGPFLAPRSGPDAALRFAYAEGLPESVRRALIAPRADPEIAAVQHFVIGSVSLAIQAALTASEEVGLEAFGIADPLKGEAREAAREIVRYGSRVREGRNGEPFCLVFGGETTVTLGASHGTGGRCQEMALAVAPRLEHLPGCAFLAAGTDGSDGPTDAAGATADPDTVSRAKVAGWDVRKAVEDHDAYPCLKASGNLIVTGPTGSNVNDVALFVSLPD